MSDEKLKRRLRIGYIVFGVLAALKVAEYFVAKMFPVGDWPYLVILAVISAGLIAYFYKHISQLWHSEGKEDG